MQTLITKLIVTLLPLRSIIWGRKSVVGPSDVVVDVC